MGALEQLLVVQDHDTATDQLLHRRANLPERAALAAREATMVDVEQRLATAQVRRDELSRSQKRLEDDLASLEAKVTEVDKRLYSGGITAPRELQALQDELGSLKRRQSQLEDQDLEVMVEADPLDAELARLGAERSAVARVKRLRLVVAGRDEGFDSGGAHVPRRDNVLAAYRLREGRRVSGSEVLSRQPTFQPAGRH